MVRAATTGVPAGWEGVLAKEWEVFPAGTPLRLMVLVGGCCGGARRYHGRTGRL